MNVTTKQEFLKLLQSVKINKVVALDINDPNDLNQLKKSALQMMQGRKQITAFLVSS